MTYEGYYDGSCVRPLEKVELKTNQRVYIVTEANHDERIIKQLSAIDGLANLLTEEEAEDVVKSMEKLRFKEISN